MEAMFRPMFRGRTYLAALFLATRFWLGLLYLTVLLVGLAIGVSTALFAVGIPLIVGAFLCARGFAAFERQLARWWLGAEIPPPGLPAPPGSSLWQRARIHLASPTTWKSVLYLLAQLPAGGVILALEVVGLAATIAAALTPLWYLLDRLTYHTTDVEFSGPLVAVIGTAPGIEPLGLAIALLIGIVGFVLLAWVLFAIDLVGRGWAQAASWMLGVSQSEQRLAEARSMAAAERARAERADQSRRELIVNLSHELRTPIASIRAHVESLTMHDGARSLDPETERYLDVVARETERLSALVDDLLTVARAEAGELHLASEPVSVAQLVHHVREALGPIARRQRKVTLFERLPAESLPSVLADPDRLTQVMMNLVRNAVTYTPEGGLVSIEAEAAGPGHVALTVADTGIGIPEEDLERVFDRSFRTDESRARSTGGFGLGLSITRELVEAMGGTIHVTSQVGSGSRFTVRLPVATAAGVR